MPAPTIAKTLKFKAVLFDFDGTLVPSLPLWVKAYHLALRHFGITLPDQDVIARCFFRDLDEIARDLDIGSGERLRLRLEAALPEAFLDAQLFPLARPILEHCRAHGLQTALVTSSPRSLLSGVLPRLELADLFDFVIAGDEVTRFKPHPEPVLTALAALGRAAHEAVMIGDSHADILAGKAAGTATALFLHEDHAPFHSFDALRATGPDVIFGDHRELPALLGLPLLVV